MVVSCIFTEDSFTNRSTLRKFLLLPTIANMNLYQYGNKRNGMPLSFVNLAAMAIITRRFLPYMKDLGERMIKGPLFANILYG